MKKVLFVCLGNICRSPAGEGVLLHYVKRDGLSDKIEVDSCGLGSWHIGKCADMRMSEEAISRGIELPSKARVITIEDFYYYDYMIPMDHKNISHIKGICPSDATTTLLPFCDLISSHEVADVPDPYFGVENGFEYVMDLMEEGCEELLNKLKKEI
ncbi:MAG: protein tyrosine phosphatase [Candidatus Cloacimonadota bacterium]|nr:MAG: protein tyrosine phosphatase [Candidatus Cloacimonadota bacterium]